MYLAYISGSKSVVVSFFFLIIAFRVQYKKYKQSRSFRKNKQREQSWGRPDEMCMSAQYGGLDLSLEESDEAMQAMEAPTAQVMDNYVYTNYLL